MEDKTPRKSKASSLRGWFNRKPPKKFNLSQFYTFSAAIEEDEYDDYADEVLVRSMDMAPYSLRNDFRIFVGTWNVAGRPPMGSLVVDLDDWLNLKDAADIYVLGFQEIVPLVTKNVIGVEDSGKAADWNLLIGKTLNDKYGCPWLTPLVTPVSDADSGEISVFGQRSSTRKIPFARHSIARDGRSMAGSRYVLLASKKMVGVFISVWIRKEMLRKYSISNVKVCSVACGIMGYFGNKGSVAVSMSIEGTSFCFIAAHLASGEKEGDERQRNRQVSEIFKRTCFNQSGAPLTIVGHDQIFWFGDLNYRLYLEDNFARQLIKKKDWGALQEFDQLRQEQINGVFQGWKEGNIQFAPTYKYSSSNCNRYSGGSLKITGEKQRTPAWCDRILWFGKGVKQLSYIRSESKFSDHRPVSALFSTQIEMVKSANPGIFTLGKLLPEIPILHEQTDVRFVNSCHQSTGSSQSYLMQETNNADKESKSSLMSLMLQDREASSAPIIK